MEFTDSRVRLFALVPSSIAKIDVVTCTHHRRVKGASCLMQKRPGWFRKLSSQNRSKNQTNHDGQSIAFRLSSCDLTDVGINRLWSKLTEAIKDKDMEAATYAKTIVEDAQRESVRRREEHGVKHEPRFFRVDKYGRWLPKIK